MKLNVLRLDHSAYFQNDFSLQEKTALEAIPEVRYLENMQSASTPDTTDEGNSLVLLTNTHSRLHQLPGPLLDKIALIVHANSGYDNITWEFVQKVKAPIILGNEIRCQAVVEYILSALFQHYTSLPQENSWSRTRTWPRLLLKDLSILIIGFGFIGKKVHQVLSSLAGSLTLYDPYKGYTSLSSSLSSSLSYDVVILCAGLGQSGHAFVDKKFLKKLSPNYLLINTSRGHFIKEADLIESLAENPSAMAYLDVFEQEPNDFSHFSHLSNVNLTSHIAGVYQHLERDILRFEKRVITDFISLPEFLQRYQECNLKNYSRDLFLFSKMES